MNVDFLTINPLPKIDEKLTLKPLPKLLLLCKICKQIFLSRLKPNITYYLTCVCLYLLNVVFSVFNQLFQKSLCSCLIVPSV